jgi:3-oxoacyl-[acyl-carrier protein] reductase
MNHHQTARVAVVTGASGGIGMAIVRRFATQGYSLVLSALEASALDTAVEEARAMGVEAVGVAGDVRDRSLADDVVAQAVARFGKIDVLVGGAGASRLAAFPEVTDDDWDDLVDINLSSAFRMSRAVARQMISQGSGGSIVQIASIGYKSGGGNPAYGAAKGGVVSLCYAMAQRLGPHGITVNAVAPGIIDTDMVRSGFPGEAFDRLERGAKSHTPMRRLGQPEDVAGVIAFLASDDAKFVTGAVIPVTGGIELLPSIGSLAGN